MDMWELRRDIVLGAFKTPLVNIDGISVAAQTEHLEMLNGGRLYSEVIRNYGGKWHQVWFGAYLIGAMPSKSMGETYRTSS